MPFLERRHLQNQQERTLVVDDIFNFQQYPMSASVLYVSALVSFPHLFPWDFLFSSPGKKGEEG